MPFTAEEHRECNRLAVQRWRAHESPDAKAKRLRQQRERRRQSAQHLRDRATLAATEERLRRDRERHERVRAPERRAPEPQQQAARHRVWGESDIPRLQPVSVDAKCECLERLQLALGGAGLDEITCAVCDSLKLATSCRIIKATDGNRVRQLRQLLSSTGEALPAELIADSHLSTDGVAENVIFEDPDANAEVGGVSENDAGAAEIDVVERRVVFVSDDYEVTTQHARVATSPSVEPQFLVRHSTQFATKDKGRYARMFPHLFLYGRGHPGDERHVHVSRYSCIRQYSQLSSRRFAEDELVMVASFDHLSVEKLFTNVAVKCQRDPARFASYSDVTEHALLIALQTK
ncbi:hypothetical protein PF011_g7475 [Phytophthora fragariae]|uniref:Uncharacterized protein n=1 Tax=Phytophthora fragariae TaxID=53985 RepID=A0A6A3L864_9STRA|nr:hypothetical protein PF011_g7475 [Phytophthora fragariae]